jgi:CRP-like cAMP-binding protein
MDRVRSTIERYVPLTETTWDLMRTRWRIINLQRGDLFTRIGSTEDRFGIVESGVLRMTFPHDGEDICIGFSYDGSWCGVYDAFVTRTPARFEVKALTDCAVHCIHHRDLQELYDTVPAMERFGRRILEELLVGRATREIEQLSLDAEERFDRFMRRSAHLLQLVPQKDVASYLRMTPETFSRLRARRS